MNMHEHLLHETGYGARYETMATYVRSGHACSKQPNHTFCFLARAATLIDLLLFVGALREATATFNATPAGSAILFTMTGTVTSCAQALCSPGMAVKTYARRFRGPGFGAIFGVAPAGPWVGAAVARGTSLPW